MDWSCGDIPAEPRNHGEERETVRGKYTEQDERKTQQWVEGGEDENIGRQQFKAGHRGAGERLGRVVQ